MVKQWVLNSTSQILPWVLRASPVQGLRHWVGHVSHDEVWGLSFCLLPTALFLLPSSFGALPPVPSPRRRQSCREFPYTRRSSRHLPVAYGGVWRDTLRVVESNPTYSDPIDCWDECPMAKKDSENWSRIETLYVVLIAFGLERLAEGAYSAWSAMALVPGWSSTASFLLLLSVALWGARLFWSATNIQRYVDRQSGTSSQAKSNLAISLHFPVLIGQSGIFFLVCESYKVVVSSVLANPCGNGIVTRCSDGPPDEIGSFALLVVASLVYNSIWLVSLMWASKWRGAPELFWIVNNLVIALLLALIATFLPSFYVVNAWQIALIYGLLLALNSILDFLKSSKVYLNS